MEERPLTPEQADLAARHFRWAMRYAWRRRKRWLHLGDDIESETMLALVRAARDWRPEFGVKFTSYFHHKSRPAVQRAAIAARLCGNAKAVERGARPIRARFRFHATSGREDPVAEAMLAEGLRLHAAGNGPRPGRGGTCKPRFRRRHPDADSA